MSDKQLAVLLIHLARQINECASTAESSLHARGASLDDALGDIAIIQLHALGSVLLDQAKMLGYVP